MDELTTKTLVDAVIAAGVGLFIGLEREHSDVHVQDGEGPEEKTPTDPVAADHLGVRTFSLVSVLGWLCGAFESRIQGLTLVGFGLVGALVALQYVRTWKAGTGITTEVAALVTFGIGLTTPHNRLLSVALALGVTLLLIAKPWVRRLVANVRRVELTATLQLAIVLAIVLPLLPKEARDPWGVLSPRRIGLFVTLIAGMNYVGYVLARALGGKRAAWIAGIVGGLASSTATTAAMAEQSRRGESLVLPAQLATLMANTIMFGRVLLLAAFLNPALPRGLFGPLGAMSFVTLAGAIWKWRALREEGGSRAAELPTLRNPFAILPALKWGAMLSAILVVAAIAREQLGSRGVMVAAAISGLADVDATTLALSRQLDDGGLTVELAAIGITIAVIANTLTKAGIAVGSGGRRFGLDIVKVFALTIVAGLLAATAQ